MMKKKIVPSLFGSGYTTEPHPHPHIPALRRQNGSANLRSLMVDISLKFIWQILHSVCSLNQRNADIDNFQTLCGPLF